MMGLKWDLIGTLLVLTLDFQDVIMCMLADYVLLHTI